MSTDMVQHLKDRHLNTSIYTGLCVGESVTVFPLWNLSGQMVGYQQYRPNGSKCERRNPKLGKYFTRISKSALTAWGLDSLDQSDRRIYLLEGVFKACRFHNLGMNALATLSNNPVHLTGWLRSLGYELYSVCDGDVAGSKLMKYGDKGIELPNGAYVDDMTPSEFAKFVRFIHIPDQ